MNIQRPPWGRNNTRQPCPCKHIRLGKVPRFDDSGKCADCKTKEKDNA